MSATTSLEEASSPTSAISEERWLVDDLGQALSFLFICCSALLSHDKPKSEDSNDEEFPLPENWEKLPIAEKVKKTQKALDAYIHLVKPNENKPDAPGIAEVFAQPRAKLDLLTSTVNEVLLLAPKADKDATLVAQLQPLLNKLEGLSGFLIQTAREADINWRYPPEKKIPVVVLTGFLGSGKTTLLNRILSEKHGKRIAVIENEFGEVGIDDELVKGQERMTSAEEIFEMNNGCICCTVRGDLVRIFKQLLSTRRDKFDYVLIETTGLADPAPIAQTFFVEPELSWQLRLDGIITVADAKHIVQHLDEVKPEGTENEALEQVGFADRIILNKTDLVSEEELKQVTERIRSINSVAPIIPAVRADIPIHQVLDVKAFDLNRVLEMEPDFLKDQQHTHDQTVTSVGVVLDGSMDADKFQEWLSKFLREDGANVYRMKGVVSIHDSPRKWVFQGVHMMLDSDILDEWSPEEKRHSKLVFIGKNLQRAKIEEAIKSCMAPAS